MMKFIYSFIYLLCFSGCSSINAVVDIDKPNFEIMTFDVVSKELNFEGPFPEYLVILTNQWFNSKVKVNGLDGNMVMTLNNYIEETSLINDTKRIDIFLNFRIVLQKPTLSKRKIIEGMVSSYGTLTGDFSLSEFDQLIENTQTDLILRLSRDLKSKI